MNVSGFIRESSAGIENSRLDKEGVLRSIAHLAKQNDLLDSIEEETVYRALNEREKISSTGFGQGIAIPHCSLDEISDFVVGILAVPEGAEFDAEDGEPVRLFVFIVGPSSRRDEHIRLLSAISRALHKSDAVEAILESTSPASLMQTFCHLAETDSNGEGGQEHSLIHFFVQNEKLLESVLSMLAGIDDSAVSVIEGTRPASFLQKVPLYASFWQDDAKGFLRIVMAVVKRPFVNEVIRQANTIASELDMRNGFMISVQDLAHAGGSLDL